MSKLISFLYSRIYR